MSWQAWSLGNWNRALVEAIFLDQERLDIPITRINASNAFLAGCTGDAACRPDEARASFVRAFGSRPAELKTHFRAANKGATGQDGYPVLIAPLYLTLLAASADESTYDLGNFRQRFAEIVRPMEIGQVNFSDLPDMWAAVAQWSKRRHRGSRDCRVLLLPPPPPSQYDRLIGFSKKLAFPTHKDECSLARLLSEHGLVGDVEPPPEAVQSAVLAELSSFTEAFNEEFRTFSHFLVQARYKDAALTPFWGAVTDITWQCTKKEASTNGSYRLVLDVGDPHEPLLYLLSDRRGRDRLAPHFQARMLPTPGKYEYILELPGGLPTEPASLARLGRDRGLERLKPWGYLQAGCVPFFPDELESFSSDGTYYEDAPACFLLRTEYVAAVAMRAKQYNLKHSILDVGRGTWKLVLLESISRGSMRALADLLPGMLHGMAGLGWARPRPRLSGGAWSGQALLLNPASNPVVLMEGATEGQFELLAEGGRVLERGQLLQAKDDGFQVPHAILDGSKDIVAVRYVLRAGDGDDVHGELRATLLGSVPSLPLAELREPGAWLWDGPSGCMEPAFPVERKTGHSTHKAAYAPAGSGHPFLRTSVSDSTISVGRRDLDELPCSLAWLGEALRLRFQSRSTLPAREVMAHVEGVAQASNLSTWNIWKLLHTGGWLARIMRRTAPYGLSMACARTIALARAGTRPVARIAGMLGEAEVARLRSLLQAGEQASRLCCDEPWLSLGTIEVELHDIGRMDELAAALNLQVLDQQVHGSPLTGNVHSRFIAGKAMTGLPGDSGLETWDPREWKWLSHSPLVSTTSAGSMFRYQRSQTSTYWVTAPHGHWKTDSEAWAWMFYVAAHGEPIGELSANGDCTFDRRVWRLPPSLVRWWLHWGGGCVAMNPSGQVVLCGAQRDVDWRRLMAWLPPEAIKTGAIDIALARRNLALKQRLGGRRRPSLR